MTNSFLRWGKVLEKFFVPAIEFFPCNESHKADLVLNLFHDLSEEIRSVERILWKLFTYSAAYRIELLPDVFLSSMVGAK